MGRGSALQACVLVALVGGSIAGVSGIYLPVETRRVPVERLVLNLERQVAANPQEVQARINLARLHGMAYALKVEEAPAAVDRKSGTELPWFGHDPKLIPYRPAPASTPAAETAAQEHLKQAIAAYEEALKLDPRNVTALLGYGWVLDQAGEDARAIEQYRSVIARAWPGEKEWSHLTPGMRSFTYEAAEYLLPLLDRDRDAAEIADLESKRARVERMPRAITPIAVPLMGDLQSDRIDDDQIDDALARVRFDADGSGLRRQWTWITPNAGWLVYDADGKGEITSALQLFGNVTFWLFWQNGYQALAALDDNDDGEVAGDELRHLAIWHDRDSDGRADPGEVAPVARHGIAGLSWRHCDGDGVRFAAVSPAGVRFADGTTRPSYDVILKSTALIGTSAEPLRIGWAGLGR